jgi:hypothetical protein
VQVDGSSDGITFAPGSVIPANTSCGAAAGIAQTPVPPAGAPPAVPVQYIRVNVTLAGTGIYSLQVTYLGYTSNPVGTQTYGLPLIEGLGKYQTSSNAVYVSAYNGGYSGCAAIQYA